MSKLYLFNYNKVNEYATRHSMYCQETETSVIFMFKGSSVFAKIPEAACQKRQEVDNTRHLSDGFRRAQRVANEIKSEVTTCLVKVII